MVGSIKSIFLYLLLLQIISNTDLIDNGVIVTLEAKEKSPKKVRVEIINEKIIKVSATAENDFSDQESLIIVDTVHLTRNHAGIQPLQQTIRHENEDHA